MSLAENLCRGCRVGIPAGSRVHLASVFRSWVCPWIASCACGVTSATGCNGHSCRRRGQLRCASPTPQAAFVRPRRVQTHHEHGPGRWCWSRPCSCYGGWPRHLGGHCCGRLPRRGTEPGGESGPRSSESPMSARTTLYHPTTATRDRRMTLVRTHHRRRLDLHCRNRSDRPSVLHRSS